MGGVTVEAAKIGVCSVPGWYGSVCEGMAWIGTNWGKAGTIGGIGGRHGPGMFGGLSSGSPPPMLGHP